MKIDRANVRKLYPKIIVALALIQFVLSFIPYEWIFRRNFWVDPYEDSYTALGVDLGFQVLCGVILILSVIMFLLLKFDKILIFKVFMVICSCFQLIFIYCRWIETHPILWVEAEVYQTIKCNMFCKCLEVISKIGKDGVVTVEAGASSLVFSELLPEFSESFF